MAGALRAGHRGRRAAPRARPRAGRRRSSTRARTRRPRATRASRARASASCCASAASTGSRSSGWPPTTASRTRRSTRCARASRSTVDPAAVRGVDVDAGRLRARARGAARRRRHRHVIEPRLRRALSALRPPHRWRLGGRARRRARRRGRRRHPGGAGAIGGQLRRLREPRRPRRAYDDLAGGVRRDRCDLDGLGATGRRPHRRVPGRPRPRLRRRAHGDGARPGRASSAHRPEPSPTGPPTATSRWSAR